MQTTRLSRPVTVVATAATAAASWAIVTQLAGVRLGVQFPHAAPSSVALASTVGASVLATAAGWVALALLERRVSRPRATWTAVAVAVLLASLGLPVAFATTTASAVGLSVIHLAVATVAITGLARTAASEGPGLGARTSSRLGAAAGAHAAS